MFCVFFPPVLLDLFVVYSCLLGFSLNFEFNVFFHVV